MQTRQKLSHREHRPESVLALSVQLRRLVPIGAVIVTMGALAACTAQVGTAQPVITSEDEIAVDNAPPEVYAYPHTEYRGRVVYLVDGRWYYPRGRRWFYYRSEPQELVRHRQYVQQATPAPRQYEPAPSEAVRVR